jgi:hypothetical protein
VAFDVTGLCALPVVASVMALRLAENTEHVDVPSGKVVRCDTKNDGGRIRMVLTRGTSPERWQGSADRSKLDSHVASAPLAQRGDLNTALSSREKLSGCSNAAKWPPLSARS